MYSQGWTPAVVSSLLLLMTYLCARGTIPSNRLIGLRLPAIRRSASTWMAGHKAALPILTILTSVIIPCSALIAFGRLPSSLDPENATVALIIITLIAAVLACATALDAARRSA